LRCGHRRVKVNWHSAVNDLELDKIGAKLHAHFYLPVPLMIVSVFDSVIHCFNDRQFHFKSCLFADWNRRRDTVYRKANQEYVIKLALNGERNFSRSQSSKSI
jgi:hypothetical protein